LPGHDEEREDARGFGSMTMGNMWAFPSKTMSYDQTLDAMKGWPDGSRAMTNECKEAGHPLDLNHVLEPEYLKAATSWPCAASSPSRSRSCARSSWASPFDAAIHDAFGKVHGRNVYATYGPDLLPNDLSAISPGLSRRAARSGAAAESAGTHSALSQRPAGSIRWSKDVEKPVGDGLPRRCPSGSRTAAWLRIKIKLRRGRPRVGRESLLAIDRIAAAAQARRGVRTGSYCLDFNERCPNVEYVLECLRRIRAGSPGGFERILYVEQPTARDLKANRANVMHEAVEAAPVVIDESLTDLESLLLARDMGYTGVALKACKGRARRC
jgi:L-alanine-DL-glutamate epimerase-like enolase superfamily enzyme